MYMKYMADFNVECFKIGLCGFTKKVEFIIISQLFHFRSKKPLLDLCATVQTGTLPLTALKKSASFFCYLITQNIA